VVEIQAGWEIESGITIEQRKKKCGSERNRIDKHQQPIVTMHFQLSPALQISHLHANRCDSALE
jgi:hypothetical protein